MSFPIDIGLGVIALDIYAIVRAVTRGHGVEGTIAWICAIIAFPGLGAIAYLLIANPSIKPATKRKRLSNAAVRTALVQRIEASPLGEQGSILRLSTTLTGLLPTQGNRVELLTENEYAFEKIEEAIQRATRSIWAEYYIISNDETGRHFLELLAAKARQGIEVLLLYDAIGSLRIDTHRLSAIRTFGGRAEAFLPVNPLRRRWAVHLRNHRKMIVVDGTVGFTGGMNVGNEYSGRMRRKKGVALFRDTHLMVEGPAVADLAYTFAEDWAFATGERLVCPPPPDPAQGGTCVVAVIPSGPDQEHNASSFVYFALIASARKRCYLSTPYFVPDEATIRALVSAAGRGVDVRVLIPGKSDVAIVAPAARSYVPTFVTAGVRIFEYTATMLHAKSLVVDGTWGLVGSANADIRSFRLNFELGALIADASFAKLLEQRFFKDLAYSREIRRDDVAHTRLPQRLVQGTCRLLSPLL